MELWTQQLDVGKSKSALQLFDPITKQSNSQVHTGSLWGGFCRKASRDLSSTNLERLVTSLLYITPYLFSFPTITSIICTKSTVKINTLYNLTVSNTCNLIVCNSLIGWTIYCKPTRNKWVYACINWVTFEFILFKGIPWLFIKNSVWNDKCVLA